MYETFDHTADLGLRARAASLDALFIDMAFALTASLVEDVRTVRPLQQVEIQVVGDDRELLLFDWLKELLYRFDTEHLLFCRYTVRITSPGLTATAWGEPLDRDRHPLGHEVKAITYHGLRVEPTPDGWLAEVIVDI